MANDKVKQIQVGSSTYDIEPANSAGLSSSDITDALGYTPGTYSKPSGGIPSSDVAFNYAGSSSKGGAATSASKLTNTSKIGDTNKPVYFSANGVPVAISYEVNKTVPSTAVFTDTTYTASKGITITSGNDIQHTNNINAYTGTPSLMLLQHDAQGHITGDVKVGLSGGLNLSNDNNIVHSNSVTAQTTQALYPVKIDSQGHISAYGTAVTSLPANGGNADTVDNKHASDFLGATATAVDSSKLGGQTPGYYAKASELKEEYIAWGGPSQVGKVGPVGMAISAEHSANRLAFINGDALVFEYSSNGGSTWTNYNYSASDKSAFCTTVKSVPIGRPNNTTDLVANQSKTRITLTAQNGTTGYVYTSTKKMLVRVSSATTLSMLVEYRSGTNYKNDGPWTTFGTYDVSGWSGWNDIPLILGTLGGGTTQTSNYWQLRLTFTCTTVSASYPKNADVMAIRIFGDNDWTSPSTMASTGHLYSFDMSKNAGFPAGVSAVTFTENGTTLANKYLGKTAQASDSAKLGGSLPAYFLDYTHLSNTPTIPAAQVQSNWTQTSTTAVDYIKNKPTSFTPSAHATTTTTYGIGTASSGSGASAVAGQYGHVMLIKGDLNGVTYTDGKAAASSHTHSQYITGLTSSNVEPVGSITYVASITNTPASASGTTVAVTGIDGGSGGFTPTSKYIRLTGSAGFSSSVTRYAKVVDGTALTSKVDKYLKFTAGTTPVSSSSFSGSATTALVTDLTATVTGSTLELSVVHGTYTPQGSITHTRGTAPGLTSTTTSTGAIAYVASASSGNTGVKFQTCTSASGTYSDATYLTYVQSVSGTGSIKLQTGTSPTTTSSNWTNVGTTGTVFIESATHEHISASVASTATVVTDVTGGTTDASTKYLKGSN